MDLVHKVAVRRSNDPAETQRPERDACQIEARGIIDRLQRAANPRLLIVRAGTMNEIMATSKISIWLEGLVCIKAICLTCTYDTVAHVFTSSG
jgi:hypothetical protein